MTHTPMRLVGNEFGFSNRSGQLFRAYELSRIEVRTDDNGHKQLFVEEDNGKKSKVLSSTSIWYNRSQIRDLMKAIEDLQADPAKA